MVKILGIWITHSVTFASAIADSSLRDEVSFGVSDSFTLESTVVLGARLRISTGFSPTLTPIITQHDDVWELQNKFGVTLHAKQNFETQKDCSSISWWCEALGWHFSLCQTTFSGRAVEWRRHIEPRRRHCCQRPNPATQVRNWQCITLPPPLLVTPPPNDTSHHPFLTCHSKGVTLLLTHKTSESVTLLTCHNPPPHPPDLSPSNRAQSQVDMWQVSSRGWNLTTPLDCTGNKHWPVRLNPLLGVAGRYCKAHLRLASQVWGGKWCLQVPSPESGRPQSPLCSCTEWTLEPL